MAALNDFNDKVGDVLNAYITAPITKKVIFDPTYPKIDIG
jgi:hypothetical protein